MEAKLAKSTRHGNMQCRLYGKTREISRPYIRHQYVGMRSSLEMIFPIFDFSVIGFSFPLYVCDF